MTNEWVLDVLADIKSFAVANGLPELAEQLSEARVIAAAEIASQTDKVATAAYVDPVGTGYDLGGAKLLNRA